MTMSVQVKVLGSIDVTRDGQAVRLAGQGQRSVLGALALEQGRPVTVDRLAETIWQYSPPATSRTKSRQCGSYERDQASRGRGSVQPSNEGRDGRRGQGDNRNDVYDPLTRRPPTRSITSKAWFGDD